MIEKKMIGRISPLFLTILLLHGSVFGQVNTGRITGRVTDQSGGVVPGAVVKAVNTSTGVATGTVSNKDGLYNFPALPTGNYTLSASAAGFKRVEQLDVHVVSGSAVNVDMRIQIGAVTQTVTVSGQASTVDTTSTSVGTTRVSEELSSLPVTAVNGYGRMAQALLRTFPGITYGPSAVDCDLLVAKSSVLGTGGGNGSSGSLSYIVDGSSAGVGIVGQPPSILGPNPDDIQELRLEDNGDAEYGSNLGVVMSLVTKSGTNQFHGSAYGYLDNDAFSARDFFNTAVSPENEYEYGVTVGGPILKDKLFFFASFDRYHYRESSAASYATVPTVLMRNGDFSQVLGPQVGTDALGRPVYQGEIYNTATATVGPGGAIVMQPFDYGGTLNVIPPADLSKASLVGMTAYPFPTLPGVTNNWLGPTPVFGRDTDRITLKLDYYHTKNKLSGEIDTVPTQRQTTACVNGYDEAPGIPVTGCVNNAGTYRRFSISDAISLAPNLLLEGSFAMNWDDGYLLTTGAGPTFAATMGLKGLLSTEAPFIDVQDYGLFGYPGSDYYGEGTMWAIRSDLAWSKGKHDAKFGFDLDRPLGITTGNDYANGDLSVLAAETEETGFPQTGWPFASFMLGDIDSGSLTTPSSIRNQSAQWGFFAEDSWRATQKLTVNYGLRWDLGIPNTNYLAKGGGCIGSNFDPTLANAGAGGIPGAEVFYGTGPGEVNRCYAPNIYYGGLGPHLGLAYALNPKTVVRAYYGIVYGPQAYQGAQGTDGTTATVSFATTNGGITPGWNWNNPFPVAIPPLPNTSPYQLNGSSINYMPVNDNQLARGQDLGIGVERQLPDQIIVKADYVGKLVHGLPEDLSYDETPDKDLALGDVLDESVNSAAAQADDIAIPYPGFTGSVEQAVKPFPQYLNVVEDAPAGYSTYNALMVTVQKHFGAGLSFLSAYTDSKYLYNGASVQSSQIRQSGKSLVIENTSGGDRPQSLNISWMYDLPFGTGKRFANTSDPVLGRVVGGWHLAATQWYFSGLPLTVTSNESLAGFSGFGGSGSTTGVWVNRNLSVPITTGTSCGQLPGPTGTATYLNVGAFSDAPPFTFGNSFVLPHTRGCGSADENVSLFKDITLKENFKLTLGMDAFNIFNRHTFGNDINTNIDEPSTYGEATGTQLDGRNIQFSLRLTF
jgi:hypothetical protein